MNLLPANRFATAGGARFLCLLLAVVLLAAAAAPETAAEAAEPLIWVRQEPAVLNANDDPLEYYPVEPRFEGSFDVYTVQETGIGLETRYVDHGYEYYHLWLDSVFDRPPLVLTPPLRYKLRASFTHGGTVNSGAEGLGAQLWYDSDGASIEPREVLAYYPWHPAFNGRSEKEWMIEAPPATREGDTFEVYAGWWNCAPCNVTWTYRAEPANAVERLGVEVVAPVIIYQGEVVPPGQTYYPETCALPASRATAACAYTQELEKQAEALIKCVEGKRENLIAILNLVHLTGEENFAVGRLIMHLVDLKLEQECLPGTRATAGHELEFALQQGAMHLGNAAAGQILRVHTPLGSATAASPGAFVTGYDPDTGTAVFRADSTPLTLQPATGAPLVLQPRQQVTQTAAGFGPVTALPHVFLPAVIR